MGKNDVLRLDVTMKDLVLVHVLKTQADFI